MRHGPALCLALLMAAPASAQDRPADDAGDIAEGADLLAEGAGRLLRGLLGAAEPGMRDLSRALEDWGLDDFGAYDPPEVLPNGDIILRRRRDAPGPGETDV